jgi:hypothetical protein
MYLILAHSHADLNGFKQQHPRDLRKVALNLILTPYHPMSNAASHKGFESISHLCAVWEIS